MALLVPLEDGVFGEDIGLVEQDDDLVERLQEVHVVVAVFLKKKMPRKLITGTGPGNWKTKRQVNFSGRGAAAQSVERPSKVPV